jgi:hypothetical protein
MPKTNITVKLINTDGNAFSIMSKVLRAMKKEKCDLKLIDQYQTEATSGDYDHLLMVTMEYVNVE